jgi:hypothetical protein
MTTAISHVYSNSTTAHLVARDLEAAGFNPGDISIIGGAPPDGVSHEDGVESAATGAAVGGLAGAGTGLLAAVGFFAIPGLGPLVAAGGLAATVAGAATGALAGGLVGALAEHGIPGEREPEPALQDVATVVTVRLEGGRADDAERIMTRHDPDDIEDLSPLKISH